MIYGITNIITGGKIIAKPRDFLNKKLDTKFFDCPMCIGLWVGMIVSFLVGGFGIEIIRYPIFQSITDGFVSSGVCWILYTIEIKLTL